MYQGILPDVALDTQDCDAGPFPSPDPLVGRKTLVEHKTLASLLISVQARAKKVRFWFWGNKDAQEGPG